ncbi:MAG: N5-glutamine methyltransferase family protein [Planctomycetota bacterium]
MPDTPTSNDVWTSRRLLTWTTAYLQQRDVDAARVVAEMLLAHVIGCERLRLYMEVDRPATAAELARYRELVAAAGRHEPVQYLVGEASFYWRTFPVNSTTLIPQPCTEVLVDHVLDWLRERGAAVSRPPADDAALLDETPPEHADGADHAGDASDTAGENAAAPQAEPEPVRLADIGTGSGCIAVSLAAQVPAAVVLATDIVPGALELAQRSAERYDVAERVQFREGDGLGPLHAEIQATGQRFDVIASNPPYIPAAERPQMDEAVRSHVPASAWAGGADGLDVLRPLIEGAHAVLEPGGLLALEIADSQRDDVLALVRANPGLRDGRVEKDQDGLWRVLLARAAN